MRGNAKVNGRSDEDEIMEYVFGPIAYPVIWLGNAVDRFQERFPVAAPIVLGIAVLVLFVIGCSV